jgi:hypothetical protein
MDWLKRQISKDLWSPYAAGVLLGITCILTVVFAKHLLGASSAVATMASSFMNAVFPSAVSDNIYFKYVFPGGFTWEVALFIGIILGGFLGGFLGALSSGSFKLNADGDRTWQEVFGKKRWVRWVLGFVGAVIIQYAAGIAGGCTSGLAISGGMLLAPSGFLFIIGMFISGIITARILFGKRY